MKNIFLFWKKPDNKSSEIINVISNIETASYSIEYKDGSIIDYSIPKIVEYMYELKKEIDTKATLANLGIYAGAIAMVASAIIFAINIYFTAQKDLAKAKQTSFEEQVQMLLRENSKIRDENSKIRDENSKIRDENYKIRDQFFDVRERLAILEERTKFK